MRAERAVAAILNAHAGVAAIVGTKIYASIAPEESTAPLLVYRKVSALRVLTLSVSAQAEVDARIEVLVVARTYEELKSLGEQVRLALAYARGTYAATDVLSITIDDEGPDEYDPDLREHAQTWVYLVKHSE